MNDIIKVYELQSSGWEFVGAFANYNLLAFTRSYSGSGTFQLFLNLNVDHAKYLKEGRAIQYAPKKSGIIKKISLVQNTGEESDIFSVYGQEVKGGLTALRITEPPTGQAEDVYDTHSEMIAKGLITNHVISPTDVDRAIPYTEVTPDDGIGSTKTFKSRYKQLDEEITKVLDADQLGWYADIQDKKVIFEVFEGLDRSAEQSVNSRVILNLKDGMVTNQEYTHSTENYCNVAYTAGQGESADREVVIVGSATGLARREVFIDARDVETTAELIARGEEKLKEFGDDTVISATADQWVFDRYEKGIDLGDIVTLVIDELQLAINARITEIEEVREESDLKLNLTFGYDYNSLKQVLDRKYKS